MKKKLKIQKITGCKCGDSFEKSTHFTNFAHDAQIQASIQAILSNVGSGGPNDSFVCSGEGLSRVCCAWNINANGSTEIACFTNTEMIYHRIT